jgi:hypothetical protein
VTAAWEIAGAGLCGRKTAPLRRRRLPNEALKFRHTLPIWPERLSRD